jgi:hypothetical protein
MGPRLLSAVWLATTHNEFLVRQLLSVLVGRGTLSQVSATASGQRLSVTNSLLMMPLKLSSQTYLG